MKLIKLETKIYTVIKVFFFIYTACSFTARDIVQDTNILSITEAIQLNVYLQR